jgi:quercetin dioxygenase-like cupin family protein
MEFIKIHEDKRGYIYLVKDLLKDNKEFTFLEVKKGFARGGCLHSNDENFVVVKGKIHYIVGDAEKVVNAGEGEVIPAGKAHAFVGIEDSIVCEWGITSEEKNMDKKDAGLRARVDRINEERVE